MLTLTQLKKTTRNFVLNIIPIKVETLQRYRCNSKFAAISEAHEILTNEEKRALYDKYGMQGVKEGGGRGGGDFGDIFNMFGMGGGGR